MSRLTYELIGSKRYVLASQLLEFALGGKKPGVPDRLLKRMIVNLANAYRKQNDVKRCNSLLGTVDWSATSDDFRICIASLNGDIDLFVSLMSKVTAEESVGMSGFREWPVFDWVRDDPRVGAEFRRLFNEDMIKKNQGVERIEAAGENSAGETNSVETVH